MKNKKSLHDNDIMKRVLQDIGDKMVAELWNKYYHRQHCYYWYKDTDEPRDTT